MLERVGNQHSRGSDRTRAHGAYRLGLDSVVDFFRFCGEHLQLAYLALLRPHGWEYLPKRCSQGTAKTDFGLKCLYWPYFSPYP